MMVQPNIDATHDPAASSWVEGADGHPDFPIQNLPLARARIGGAGHVVCAIGEFALDLGSLATEKGLAPALAAALAPVQGASLQPLMAAGPRAGQALRSALFDALRSGADAALRSTVERHLVARSGLELLLPQRPGTFADFYSSIHHAVNVGALVRPDRPLMPNYTWLPVGYHGRTSTIFPSGQDFTRPRGQVVQGPDDQIGYAPSARLDYEAELGFFVGAPSRCGEPVSAAQAHEHLFGVTLLNDWSARDIQFWEYMPLGPFLGKSFATTIGAWVVTRQALEPFRVPPPWKPDHRLLPHLDAPGQRALGGFDIKVEVHLQTGSMRRQGLPRHRLSVSTCATSYWTVGQMIAHQTSNGANLEAGDLIGSGTLSGPEEVSRGCLLEITRGGQQAVALPGGEQRPFRQDGDGVTLVGYCEAPGRARIGLGEATARVLPATATSD